MRTYLRSLPLFTLLALCPALLHAQSDTTAMAVDSICKQRDVSDVIRGALNKPPKVDSASAGSILLIPIIGSNPATGFMLGIGLQWGFKFEGPQTRYSMISGSVQFTSLEQKIFLLKNTVYTKNNKMFFSGDWRYLIFSQATYGLGTNAPEGGVLSFQYAAAGEPTADDSLAQPLNYNFLRLYQSASYQIKGDFYAGLGYCLDSYSKIVDNKLRLNPGDTLIMSHYGYNTHYGFDTEEYFISTMNVNLVHDTRDNMISPYKGHFALVTLRSGLKLLGNQEATNFLYTEWRSFHSLSHRNPRHLVAFWLMGEFTPAGKYAYMNLPATAYDQRSRSARGYTQGRFRGDDLVYGEVEYRFPISKCGGVLGGVLFANATTASNPISEVALMQYIKPGYGMGLRLMVDKKTRTNLAVDFGWGERSFGFYLAATETF